MAILGFWVFVSLMAAGAAEAVRIQLGRMLRPDADSWPTSHPRATAIGS